MRSTKERDMFETNLHASFKENGKFTVKGGNIDILKACSNVLKAGTAIADNKQIIDCTQAFKAQWVCIGEIITNSKDAIFLSARLFNVASGRLINYTDEVEVRLPDNPLSWREATDMVVKQLTGIVRPKAEQIADSATIAKRYMREGFMVEAAKIGEPLYDGMKGVITHTGGRYYNVRSMGGVWWMIDNANKPLYATDGCAGNSINKYTYGHIYSYQCAKKACPEGWTLPDDEDFYALEWWLKEHEEYWREWNSENALAGYGTKKGYKGKEKYGCFVSDSPKGNNGSRFVVNKDEQYGTILEAYKGVSYSVRCLKKKTYVPKILKGTPTSY